MIPKCAGFYDYFKKANKLQFDNAIYRADETDLNYGNEMLNSQITQAEKNIGVKSVLRW